MKIHPAKEVAWVVLGQAVAVLGALCGVRVLTQVLSPTTYGEFALGMTVVTLAHQVLTGPLTSASLRFVGAAIEGKDLASFWCALRRLIREASGVVVAIGAGVLLVLAAITGSVRWIGLAVAALFFSIVSGASSVLDGMQNGARQRQVVAWHDGVSPWLRFSVALALIRLFGPSGESAMAGYAVGAALILASQAWFLSKLLSNRVGAVPATAERVAAWRTQILSYGAPFATWGIFSGLQFISDRWALQLFSTTSTVGLYAVLYQLGFYPMSLLSGLLSQSIIPVVFARAGDGTDPRRVESGDRLVRVVLVSTLATTALLTAALVPLHGLVFALFVGPQFREVGRLLPWMVLSGGLFAAGQTCTLLLLSKKKSAALITPRIVTSLAGAVLCMVGARFGGIDGVVLAGVLASLSFLGWTMLLVRSARAKAAG